jgi:ribose transport system ATP-binding protein
LKVEKPAINRKEIVFEAKRVSIPGKISNFNMQLFKGEILGIAGLMGSGKDELVKAFFGLWPTESKELYFEGERINLKNPEDAIKSGIVYLPEERKSESIFAELSVALNISPMYLFNKYNKPVVSKRDEKNFAEKYIDKLNIKTPSPNEEMMYLSGGNQQKAIFARLLAVQPSLMILNDPTRGIDIGSKEEIYKSIRSLSESGTSIILVSSEIEEITYLANRVIVLSKGEIHGEFVDNQVTLENILRCAVRVKTC